MPNVMIDIETLGTKAGCTILSIGAVRFDHRGVYGEPFYREISRESSEACKLVEDPKTLSWWLNQKEEKSLLDRCRQGGSHMIDALRQFEKWLDDPEVKVWGNGSDFDNVILAAAYNAIGSTQPWAFYNNRCYRTVKNLYPTVKIERIGSHHNALDDAISQAGHLIKMLSPLA